MEVIAICFEVHPMLPARNIDQLTADQRLDEASAILAAGIVRYLEKQKTEKIPLDKSPKTRPYVRKTTRNGERT
ncbi:MAG: hypothetical protein HQL56_07220 [Magnetococcales bacterium]|nr:hypothetical protein [Magnetococcales bacterium]